MKLKLLLIMTIMSASLLAGCKAAEAGAYKQAIRAIEEGDYDNALTLLDGANDANDRNVCRARGLAHLSKGEYKKAIDDFCECLGKSNGIIEELDIDTSLYLAVAFFEDNQRDEAIKTLDSVLAIKPERDNAYYLRGRIKLANGDKAGAIEDYDRVIALAPSNYDHYIRICEDLREYGYKQESDAYIEKAISSGGKLSDYNKGVLEFYLESYTDARNDLENARKNKNSDNLLLYLGRTYEALGDLGYAISLYEQALEQNPKQGKIYNQLAIAKINQKDYEGALDTIEQGLAGGSKEGEQGLLFNRVVCYENLYDFDKAEECMKEYLDKYPNDEKAIRENIFLSTR